MGKRTVPESSGRRGNKVTGFLAKGVADGQLGRVLAGGATPGAPQEAPRYEGFRLDMAAEAPGSSPTRVLFVCLGNICRSPLAEGVFKHLVDEAGLSGKFAIDSAGTGSWHVGERPDARAAMVAREHGVELDSRARQVTEQDLREFDYVIAMDRENLRSLERLAGASEATAEIGLLRAYEPDPDSEEVPDPYYGGVSGFENVYDIVARSCEGLLTRLRALAGR